LMISVAPGHLFSSPQTARSTADDFIIIIELQATVGRF
jgi:hypothetical protein